jgi:hypothetical protein
MNLPLFGIASNLVPFLLAVLSLLRRGLLIDTQSLASMAIPRARPF